MTLMVKVADEQAVALEMLSQRENRSVDEIVKEALDSHLADRNIKPRASVMDDPVFHAAFGSWKGLLKEDGVEYQRRLRAEWDDRP